MEEVTFEERRAVRYKSADWINGVRAFQVEGNFASGIVSSGKLQHSEMTRGTVLGMGYSEFFWKVGQNVKGFGLLLRSFEFSLVGGRYNLT